MDERRTLDAAQLDRYFARVGLDRRPAADEEGLRALHQAQFMTLPFENFDIQLGRPIRLGRDDLLAKLVDRRRGGYCFELNGLMLMVLHTLGFTARPLLGRVHLKEPVQGRTHQVNLVEIGDRRWIMDVGFGAGGPRCPLPLALDHVAEGPGWAFRLVEREPWGVLMQSRIDGAWRDSYSFDQSYATLADINVANHYTSTSPASHFVTSRVASRPLPDGRVSISDFTLTRIAGQEQTTEELAPGAGYLQVLEDTFGIELDAAYDDLKAVGQVPGGRRGRAVADPSDRGALAGD